VRSDVEQEHGVRGERAALTRVRATLDFSRSDCGIGDMIVMRVTEPIQAKPSSYPCLPIILPQSAKKLHGPNIDNTLEKRRHESFGSSAS
jgi:hypothetical protein